LRAGVALALLFVTTFFDDFLTAMPNLFSNSSMNLFGLRELLGLCPVALQSFKTLS